ncbi:MAG: DUF4345 family protein [Gemmatimonadales bacterium]|nr:DUF4345 family protein [Gemmatimonadales bacterium]MDX2060552.1 DUF4345 family protein [Gemmatimonadales bacterium]
MTFPRVVLGLTGAVFVTLGLGFLVAPEGLLGLMKIQVSPERALLEIRAMYGGLELGLGVFFIVAVFRERWIRAALGAQFLVLGGMGSTRLLALLFAGRSDRLMVAFAVAEVIGAVLGIGAFGQARRILVNNRFERRRVD